MKTKITALCAGLLLAAFATMNADEPAKAKTGSPEFERLKTLVGTWTGKVDMGQGPQDMTMEFRLTAGGTALEQRSAPGTPMEMVSMFYDKGGKVAMTHYCILGNRPEMALKSSDAKSITFDLDAACCTFDPKKESHMRGISIVFDDANTFTSGCQAIMDGKEMPAHPSTFHRVKSETATK